MDVQMLHSLLGKLIDEGLGDLEVTTEGCDCDGEVNNVTVEPTFGTDDHHVYLRRETAQEQAQREENYRRAMERGVG